MTSPFSIGRPWETANNRANFVKVLETERIEPSACKGREQLLRFDETHVPMSAVMTQPCQIGEHAFSRSPSTKCPGERVAGAQSEQTEAGRLLIAASRLFADRSDHLHECAVAAPRQHHWITGFDDVDRDTVRLVEAPRQKQIAATDQSVEAFDELVRHLPGVAVQDDGHPIGLGRQGARAAEVRRPR